MQNILIVDDEKLFLKSLREGLRPHAKKHNFRILTAEDGRKAIEILDKEEVLVMITDIKMPEIDGLKLISYAMSHFPLLPVVVMTAYGSPLIRRIASEKGVLHYLEKPIEFDEVLKIILELLKSGKRRKVQGVTLPSFLQLLEMEKSSCTVAVVSEGSRGFFYIQDGRLLAAETGERNGIAAAVEMLDWSVVQIELQEACPKKTGPAIGSLTEVLLEAYRIKDERVNKAGDDGEELSIEIEDARDWEIARDADFSPADFLELKEPMPEAPPPSPAAGAHNQKSISITTESGIKEVDMNIPKLNKAIDSLRESLGTALISTDIFGAEDGQSVASFNTQPTASAVFAQMTNQMNAALKDAKFPEIGRYYIIDLVDKKLVVIIPMGDFIWGILIDGTKAQLGLLLNLAIPKAIGAFEEALAE